MSLSENDKMIAFMLTHGSGGVI